MRILFNLFLWLSILSGCSQKTLTIEKEELTGLPRCSVKVSPSSSDNIKSALVEISRQVTTIAKTPDTEFMKGKIEITKNGKNYQYHIDPNILIEIDGYTKVLKPIWASNVQHEQIDQAHTYTPYGNITIGIPSDLTNTSYLILLKKDMIRDLSKAKNSKIIVYGGTLKNPDHDPDQIVLEFSEENRSAIDEFYKKCILTSPELKEGNQT